MHESLADMGIIDSGKLCTFVQNLLLLVIAGDAVTSRYNQNPAKCEKNVFQGQTYTVYDRTNLKSNNNEVVW